MGRMNNLKEIRHFRVESAKDGENYHEHTKSNSITSVDYTRSKHGAKGTHSKSCRHSSRTLYNTAIWRYNYRVIIMKKLSMKEIMWMEYNRPMTTPLCTPTKWSRAWKEAPLIILVYAFMGFLYYVLL